MTTAIGSRYLSGFERGFERERSLTVTEWADEHRVLSSVSAAEPGRWRTARTPYLRAIMDALSPASGTSRVVFMKGAQVGGTECGNNWIGFTIHRHPGPMLMVLPTVEVARKVSKQRLAPMIEASAILRDLVRDPRSRDSGNTVQVKEFEGGLLMVTGANSAAGLRSMPVRDLFMDEIDEYPGDLDGQGDPISLAERRTDTFAGSRHELLVSTPKVKGVSRIEREYLRSDQRRYFVPCPKCGHMDFMTWTGRDWLTSDDGSHHYIEWDERKPETVRLVCGNAECAERITERNKTWMLARGEWRATNEEAWDGRTAGFHLSALYSPLGWKSWTECVAEFLAARNDPPALKAWVNTVLGEAWEERGDSVNAQRLRGRCEELERGVVPIGVGVLVAAVDVQSDRLEVVVKGYGAGEESWLVEHEAIFGDPSQASVWYALDKFLARDFRHVNGRELRVECAVVDSGGLHTEEVYGYTKPRLERRAGGWTLRTFPIKGGTEQGKPLVQRPSTGNRYRVPLFVLCVDTGKDTILSRLLVNTPGAGFVHLPRWVDDEYLEQLASEKAVRKYHRGRGLVREWVKLRERNEALDLEVYALAGLQITGSAFMRRLAERADRFATPPAKGEEPIAPPEATLQAPGEAFARKRARAGWVNRWRE